MKNEHLTEKIDIIDIPKEIKEIMIENKQKKVFMRKIYIIVVFLIILIILSIMSSIFFITNYNEKDESTTSSITYEESEDISTDTSNEVLIVDLKNGTDTEIQEEQPAKNNEDVQQEEEEQPVKNNEDVQQEEEEQSYIDVDETVYAINNVNIRALPNSSSEKLGVLFAGNSIKRVAIGSLGWDKVVYNENVAYISHNYLSKEQVKVVEKNVEQKVNYVTASKQNASAYPDGWIDKFNETIIELQKQFLNGAYWNHMGYDSATNDNYKIVTNIPCNHSVNGERYCNSYTGKADDGYPYHDKSIECLGFANMLSDMVFGKDADVRIYYDYDEIKIGDLARINNNMHTVFIIDKTDDYIVVAECNADYRTCRINWGRKISRDKVIGWFISRWN